MKARREHRISYWVLAGSVIALVVVIVLVLQRPTLRSEAVRLASCIKSQNADCVLGFVSETEQRALGGDQTAHLRMVEYSIALNVSAGGVEVTTATENAEFVGRDEFYAKWDTPEGTVEVPLDLAYTDEGIRGTNLVTTLLLQRWRRDPRPVEATTRSGSVMMRILRGVKEDRAHLESLGMQGLLYKNKAMTLSEFEAYCSDAVRRAENPQPSE